MDQSAIIESNVQSFKDRLADILKTLHQLTLNIGHDELASTVSDLRESVHEPFLFVIVGEVKAGKSSFINALLDTGVEITKVAPQPMTDTIQQIVYGENKEIIEINPYLKKIRVPVEILKEVSIVDTPGTNTIIEHHQEITERFIPSSDLIVFVFEAKNPYRESAWNFFNYIHEDWKKKVIFVLQQKDLMPEDDLNVNINGVKEYAVQKGIEHPMVYALSAKQEQEGQKEKSGFAPLRAYIKNNITGGKAAILKVKSGMETATNINSRISEGINLRHRQWEADLLFRADINETLEQQQGISQNQAANLVENIIAAYDRITIEKEKKLKAGLSFFSLLKKSVSAIFNKESNPTNWLKGLAEELDKELTDTMTEKTNTGIKDLADSISQMVNIIHLKIKNSETILKNDHEFFSQIAQQRGNVLRDLENSFMRFINETDNFTDSRLFPNKQALSPNLATGSGVAALGVILMAVTQAAVFDITGGILTTIGLLFAGVSTGVRKRKILKGFHEEIANGRTHLQTELTEKLNMYIQELKDKIGAQFSKFDQMLEQEKESIADLENKRDQITERIDKLMHDVMV